MDRKRHSFILHMWLENESYSADYAPALRGSIQRIGTDQVHYFNTLQHLTQTLEYLMGWLDSAPPSSSSSTLQKNTEEESYTDIQYGDCDV